MTYEALSHTLMTRQPGRSFRAAALTGLLDEMLPEARRDRDFRPVDVACRAPQLATLRVRWALVLDGERAEDAMLRLSAPRQMRRDVAALAANRFPLDDDLIPLDVRRLRVQYGDALLHDLIFVTVAEVIAAGSDTEHLEILAWAELVRHQAQEQGIPTSVRDLAINGRDLRDAGVAEGEAVGRVLDVLLNEVLYYPAANTRDYLLMRGVAFSDENQRKAEDSNPRL